MIICLTNKIDTENQHTMGATLNNGKQLQNHRLKTVSSQFGILF